MPLYEYKCLTCDLTFEFLKLRSDEKIECEKCGEKDERKLEQQISKDTSFNLVGRGWYKDKYNGSDN
jgi:putative FmdB family regulatory protein